MSLLWTIPVLAVVVGAVLVILQMRVAAGAAAELGDALRRVQEVRVAVDEVRREGVRCGETGSRLRTRSPSPTA
jgi:uncharacterized membrane-anchored protein YhcB (DUF1043 family)